MSSSSSNHIKQYHGNLAQHHKDQTDKLKKRAEASGGANKTANTPAKNQEAKDYFSPQHGNKKEAPKRSTR
ncbi:hypothetical protein HYFRA_00000612 [Hymenoscyphus fraxineus]|uniref:Uncharacterized protein n=1 Tax=Hymenoscyphus fraxineus TaxID=746836 RepID=A0A9N9L533_9HELO|nr:hypothetical protein HYFRA_00000612 [Hymenoscyphus fraxineus]